MVDAWTKIQVLILMDIITVVRQLPQRKRSGEGIRPTKPVAIDPTIAKAARDIAEKYHVTMNSFAGFAVQRLIADVKAAEASSED
jgi:hypothetical protein